MKRSLFGTVAIAAVALSVVLIGAASAAKPPPAPTNNTCPTNARNLPTSDIVGASASSSASTSTYTFESFTDPAQTSQGTPGLVNYCVYTTANPGPTAVTASSGLAGADGSLWKASKPGKNFGFSRPGGEKTNIELNGPPQSRWAPLRGRGRSAPRRRRSSSTSAARPSAPVSASPVPPASSFRGPSRGRSVTLLLLAIANAAYNNIPKDAINCGPPSHAFEGTSTKEFGDEVELGKDGNLQSLTVLFNSYACKDFPLWNSGQCTTDPLSDPVGDTFTHEITAHIYSASSGGVPGALLASATKTFTIPYRPSANPAVSGDNGGDPAALVQHRLGDLCVLRSRRSSRGTRQSWDSDPLPLGERGLDGRVQHESLRRLAYGPCGLQRNRCRLSVRLAERRNEDVRRFAVRRWRTLTTTEPSSTPPGRASTATTARPRGRSARARTRPRPATTSGPSRRRRTPRVTRTTRRTPGSATSRWA